MLSEIKNIFTSCINGWALVERDDTPSYFGWALERVLIHLHNFLWSNVGYRY